MKSLTIQTLLATLITALLVILAVQVIDSRAFDEGIVQKDNNTREINL